MSADSDSNDTATAGTGRARRQLGTDDADIDGVAVTLASVTLASNPTAGGRV